MQLNGQAVNGVVSLADAQEQRIIRQEADLLHPFAKPVEIAQGRLKRSV
jgi:hypothetical protein